MSASKRDADPTRCVPRLRALPRESLCWPPSSVDTPRYRVALYPTVDEIQLFGTLEEGDKLATLLGDFGTSGRLGFLVADMAWQRLVVRVECCPVEIVTREDIVRSIHQHLQFVVLSESVRAPSSSNRLHHDLPDPTIGGWRIGGRHGQRRRPRG